MTYPLQPSPATVPGPGLLSRTAVDAAMAVMWNTAGHEKGLLPLAWKLGESWDGIHFAGDADTYALELRRDIIEAWIAALGLADDVSLWSEPIHRDGSDVVWIGTVDGIAFRLTYPAELDTGA